MLYLDDISEVRPGKLSYVVDGNQYPLVSVYVNVCVICITYYHISAYIYIPTYLYIYISTYLYIVLDDCGFRNYHHAARGNTATERQVAVQVPVIY